MIINSLDQLNQISLKIIKEVQKEDCILLFGEIGVGKTTLTRAIINNLQTYNKQKETEVLIPTFNILYEYEIKSLKYYLIGCIDKKTLSRNKDIEYEKETCIINNIPQLHFNNTTRKFTLKKHYKHVSTAKCLVPPKRKKSPKSTRKLSPREDKN